MGNFIYLSDTHVGTDAVGYYQQTSYVKYFPQIIVKLRAWLLEHTDVKFVLHGGDMIDKTSSQNIALAAELFAQLPVPTYLCLGNHDVTENNAIDLWMKYGNTFFKNNNYFYSIVYSDYAIHVMPCHWCEKTNFWSKTGSQKPYFLDDQIEYLDKIISKNSDKIHIVLTHAPVFGLPISQTGFTEPYHPSTELFKNKMTELAKRYSSLKIVLGAHNHMNMCVKYSDSTFITTSSFSEAPFDFKYFNTDNNTISMSTISLFRNVDFAVDYDFNKTFVQGRPSDRNFDCQVD